MAGEKKAAPAKLGKEARRTYRKMLAGLLTEGEMGALGKEGGARLEIMARMLRGEVLEGADELKGMSFLREKIFEEAWERLMSLRTKMRLPAMMDMTVGAAKRGNMMAFTRMMEYLGYRPVGGVLTKQPESGVGKQTVAEQRRALEEAAKRAGYDLRTAEGLEGYTEEVPLGGDEAAVGGEAA